jgi:hypothetical protein
MKDPLPYLPGKFQKIIRSLKEMQTPSWLIVYILGFLATTWFIIRVVPKPSRAKYPCMQVCAPFMSAFVVQMTALIISVWSFRRYRSFFKQNRSILALSFLFIAIAGWMIAFSIPSKIAESMSFSGSQSFYPPNDPVGNATGIYPGRVAWYWDSTATNFFCTNTVNNNGIIDPGDDAWFMEKNNNPAVIDSMLSVCILKITGKQTLAEAWDTLFRYYNANHGNGNTGYQAGQKVFIKLNCVGAYGNAGDHLNADLSRRDFALTGFALTTISNPFVAHSLLKQLVIYAGIPQDMIYIGDPMQNIFKEDYDLWHNSFPGIHYLGNDIFHTGLDSLESLGRTPVVKGTSLIYYSDHKTVMPDAGTDTLYTVFDFADYIINLPAMKAHAAAGISLAAKNNWGSITRSLAWHLHDGLVSKYNDLPYRTEYFMYRAQTDMMEHKLTGGKVMLIIVDGLFCGDEAGCIPQHWTSYPFNNNWASSIYVSQDPVAIESVCFDFLRTEYNGQNGKCNRPNYGAVDDYLHQAADSSLWAPGIVYDPDNDMILYSSLGVHEHWNDSVQKEYSRNLGTGNGIELYKVHENLTGINNLYPVFNIDIYPNPADDVVVIKNNENKELNFQLLDLNGKIVLSGTTHANTQIIIDISSKEAGIYLFCFSAGETKMSYKIIKQ